MSISPAQLDQFVSDLQNHLDDVATVHVPTHELHEVLNRLRNDGHTAMPLPEPMGSDDAHDKVFTRDTDTGELRIYDVIAGQG